MQKKKTQSEVILEHLQKYGTITSKEAIKKYSITRLAAVISKLRDKGYDIESVNKPVKSRKYKSTAVAEYRLSK